MCQCNCSTDNITLLHHASMLGSWNRDLRPIVSCPSKGILGQSAYRRRSSIRNDKQMDMHYYIGNNFICEIINTTCRFILLVISSRYVQLFDTLTRCCTLFMRYDGTFSRLSKSTDIFDWSRNQHRSIEKEMHGTKVDTEDRVTHCRSILLMVFLLSIWLPKYVRDRCGAVAIAIIHFRPYIFFLFDQCRAYIIDQVEHGVHDRLHIYTLCGIFSLPWHRHQIEGTKGL